MKRLKILYPLIFSLLSCRDTDQFISNSKTTNALIVNVHKTFRIGQYKIDYEYSVNDKKILGNRTRIIDGCSKRIIGKQLPLLYDSTKIEAHALLLSKWDFEHYGIAQPDSLKWINECK
jgi:hypothetical protein